MGSLKNTDDSVYQPGQEWSYKTRSGEDGSTLVICKVQAHPKMGTIIHISLRGLNIKNPLQKTGFSDVITHLPFTEEAIDNSVVKVLNKDTKLPEDLQEDFTQAFEEWCTAFEQGKATILGSTLAETLDYIEGSINSEEQ
jgi:hypothetical protein